MTTGSAMDNLIPDKLKDIVARHGRTLLEDRQRCANILAENFPGAVVETEALSVALKHKVPQKLFDLPRSAVTTTLMQNIGKQVAEKTGLREDVARWAVDAWATGVGHTLPVAPTVRNEQKVNGDNELHPNPEPHVEPWGPRLSDENEKTTAKSLTPLKHLTDFFTFVQFEGWGKWTIAVVTICYLGSILFVLDGTLSSFEVCLLFFSLTFICTRWCRAAAMAGLIFTALVSIPIYSSLYYDFGSLYRALGGGYRTSELVTDQEKGAGYVITAMVVFPIWCALAFLSILLHERG